MKNGDIVLYSSEYITGETDFAIVTTWKGGTHWAYWVKDKKVLRFFPEGECYRFVGPSILGEWKE